MSKYIRMNREALFQSPKPRRATEIRDDTAAMSPFSLYPDDASDCSSVSLDFEEKSLKGEEDEKKNDDDMFFYSLFQSVSLDQRRRRVHNRSNCLDTLLLQEDSESKMVSTGGEEEEGEEEQEELQLSKASLWIDGRRQSNDAIMLRMNGRTVVKQRNSYTTRRRDNIKKEIFTHSNMEQSSRKRMSSSARALSKN